MSMFNFWYFVVAPMNTLFNAPIAFCSVNYGLGGYAFTGYDFFCRLYFLGDYFVGLSISWNKTLSDISETLWGIRSL